MVSEFLKKFFRPQQKCIIFTFTGEKNNINIDIKYQQCSSDYIAAIIYTLNNGLFLGKMVQNLTDNIEIKNNNDILEKLDQLYILERQNDVMVKPLETFKKNVN